MLMIMMNQTAAMVTVAPVLVKPVHLALQTASALEEPSAAVRNVFSFPIVRIAMTRIHAQLTHALAREHAPQLAKTLH